MPFDFWTWADPSEVDQLRALDFERQAKDSIQKADASLWARDAGQLLDQSRSQIGDIGNTLNSVRSAVAEPVQKAVEPVQRAAQGGQQAADQFSEWAGSRLGEVRSKLPGYDALDQPSTTPARDDWRVGDQPSEPAKPPSVASEGSGSALLDALNDHVSPVKVTKQPELPVPPKPVDQPFPPDTTVTRDDYRKEWRPQLYQETPNATPPWSGEQRGTVNPGLAPLDNALRQVQDLFGGSRANPNPGQSQYNGLYTDPATYGGNAVSATPHQIGINARDHLVGVMRDYWQASGKEPDSDQGLSSIARVLAESMAHEVAHDTTPEHTPVHGAITKQISQADGSAGYQTIYTALKQMRDAGDLERVVDTAKSGTSPNPNEIALGQRPAMTGMSPLERGGADGSSADAPAQSSSPLLDALGDFSNGLAGGLNRAADALTSGLNSAGAPEALPTPEQTSADGGIGSAVLSGLGAQDATDRFNQQGEQSGRTKLWNDFLGTIGVIHDQSVQKAAQEFADAQARGESTDGVFDRLKLTIRSGVMQEAAGQALKPAEQLAVQLMADSEDATAQAADAALKMFGIDREGKGGTPNPLGTGQIGGVAVPGLRGVGEALGVDPKARIGLADAVHVADAFKPLQAVAQGGQFVEHPLETAGALAGIHYGGKLIGKAGEALADSAPVRRAGEIVGGLRDLSNSMTRGLPGGAPGLGVVEADRYYHGTGGAFDRPNPATFSEEGLFGAGYYLTSDPRVAGSGDLNNPGYAESRVKSENTFAQHEIDRLTEQWQAATPEYRANNDWIPRQIDELSRSMQTPNVRAVDVPRDLRLLDADGTYSAEEGAQIIRQAMANGEPNPILARLTERNLATRGDQPFTGQNIWDMLGGPKGGSANKRLQAAGFDGITYSGGKRIPMQDEAGKNIEHTATMIFGDSLDKITNATSGLKGGLLPDGTPKVDHSAPVGDPTLAAEADRLSTGVLTPRQEVQAKIEAARSMMDSTDPQVRDTFQQVVDALQQHLETLPSDPTPHPFARTPGRTLASQSIGGALASGYQASQEDGSTPQDVFGAMALGLATGGLHGTLARRGSGQAIARAVAQNYGPAMEKVDASITPPARSGPKAGNLPGEVIRQLFDNAVGLRTIGEQAAGALGRPLAFAEDAYKLLRLSRGSAAAAEQHLNEALGPVLKGVDDQGIHDLNLYLKAQDTIDKAAAVGNPARNFGGMTAADAQQAIGELHSTLGQQGFAALDAKAQQVWQFGHDMLDRKVQAGLVDPQLAQELQTKYPHYSPIKIIDWLDDASGTMVSGSNQRLSVAQNGLKRLTEAGTARAAEAPLNAYVRLAYETERLASKNVAAQAFIDYFKQVPALAGLIKPANQAAAAALGQTGPLGHRAPGEAGFSVFVNGEQQHFYIDKSIERAFNYTGWDLHNPVGFAFQTAANVLRAGATGLNVLFLLPNAVGDAMTYLVRNGGLVDLPKNLAYLGKGYAGAIGKDADYAALQKLGGGMAGWFTGEANAGAKTVNDLRGAVNGADQLWRWVRGVMTLEPVKAVGGTVETATRLAQFKKDLAGGADPRQAALNARDVSVDFQRGGEFAKALNSIVPFFNVGFQAPAQVVRAIQNPETRARALLGVSTMVIAPTVGLEVYNRKDPTYADVPQRDKDRGLIIMDPRGPGPVSPETGRPVPRYALINMREWTPFVIATREAMGKALGDNNRAWQDAAQSMLRSASPIEPSQNAVFDVLPTPLRVGAELVSNYDAFRGQPIVPDSLKNLPAAEQYTSRTSETAKAIGRAINKPPVAVEHLVTGLGAGLGRQVLAASDLALKATGRTPDPSRRVAQLQQELAKSGLPPEKQASLEHELQAEQTKQQARATQLREQPLVGGLAGTIYREGGGQLDQQAAAKTDQRLEAAKRGQTPAAAEMKRLGVNLSDVTGDIAGTRLNRAQAQQYRDQALNYRQQMAEQLVRLPAYQQADDTEKTRMLQGALGRAAAWAGQAIVKRPDAEGYEFTTAKVGQDPAKAVDGYLKAVALQEQLKQAQATRYLGVKGPAAEQLMGDVRELGAFRQALGKARGDMEFVRKVGAARYAKADGAQVDPRYDLLRTRIEKDPNYATYFGSRAVLDLAR